MRIKKIEIQENVALAKKIGKNDANAVADKLPDVSREIEPIISAVSDDPETVKNISDKMAASALEKAYSGEDSELSESGDDKVHTAKFDRCVADVKKRGGVDNAYAICQDSLGADAIKKSHRTKPESQYEDTGEDFGDIPGGDIEAGEDEYLERKMLKRLANDGEGLDYSEKPDDNDGLPFESVRPKMTKNQLIEAVVGKKKRKVLKTIKIKNLRNE